MTSALLKSFLITRRVSQSLSLSVVRAKSKKSNTQQMKTYKFKFAILGWQELGWLNVVMNNDTMFKVIEHGYSFCHFQRPL
jgi:hypothetical protein